MTADYRAELQLLFDAAESFTEPALGHHRAWEAAMNRAHALLDQEELEVLTDEKLLELMPQQFRDDLAAVSRTAAHGAGPGVTPGIFRVSLNTGALSYARAAIAADRARRPAPQPPADGEVAELVETLKGIAYWRRHGKPGGIVPGFFDIRQADRLDRAADLLQRFASPTCLVIDPGGGPSRRA